MDQGLQDYQDQKKSIENFFPRFPSKPDFKGKTILEFGLYWSEMLESVIAFGLFISDLIANSNQILNKSIGFVWIGINFSLSNIFS